MHLPFTPAQFFAVFAAYNEAVWPLQVAFFAVAIAIAYMAIRAPARGGRWVSLGLALLWSWLAIGYHLAYFWSISPAAPLFAAISLVAAFAFAWLGVVHESLKFRSGMDGRKVGGLLIVIFALAGYPAIGALTGHHYPAAPTFGLPRPTTIFTFGVLLMAAQPLPRWVVIAPMVWAAIGAFAAVTLGVTQDLALLLMLPIGRYMLFTAKGKIETSRI